MRALSPLRHGFVERDGVRVFYEVYGEGDPTVFLPPDRVLGVCAINPGMALTPPHPFMTEYDFNAQPS